MGKLFEGIGQLVVGVNYLFSCFFVLVNYGPFWGLVSFFVPPIGAVAAPFFVNTWGFFLVGAGFFIIGSVINRSEEKKMFQRHFEYSQSLDKQLATQLMDSEIVTRANATMMLAGMQPFGPGKLLGSPTGSLFWIGDSGYQFNIEKNLREWGNSEFKLKSNDLYITLTTMNEFSVSEEDSSKWIPWLQKHYPDKSNL
jgi:hypothetical protein